MIYPDFKQFKKLATKGNLIPIFTEIPADLETPVSAFLKVKNDYSYLLESVEGGEKLARYSFIGCQPSLIFFSNKDEVCWQKDGKIKTKKTSSPLNELREKMSQYHPVEIEGLPRFYGGAVGYIGYDFVRFFENIPDKNISNFNFPDSFLLFTDNILIFDHLYHKIKIVSCIFLDKKYPLEKYYAEGVKKINQIIKKLKTPCSQKLENKKSKIDFHSNFSQDEFKKIVRKAKKYINEGEAIQIVLSQRWEFPLQEDPFQIYRNLRIINPSSYMYYLCCGERKIIGSSPEILVRKEGKKVEVRPIAGTRPRGKNEIEDKKLEEQLLHDPKENAEHIMLVDLGRNDLGKICEYGSVKVNEFMVIEKYSYVMHIVSNVEGKLRKNVDCFDVLSACFPAGTVTGSPKIRAMEIIDELENLRRGPYAGAVGYFNFNGNMDLAIAIRSIFIEGKRGFFQAGAGIVSDSNPQKEYEETINKSKAMLEAVKK